MLRGKHRHLIGVSLHFLTIWIIANYRFHRLLVVLTAIVAIVKVITLYVDNGGALTEFTAHSLHLILGWRPVITWHCWQTATLSSWLGDCALSVMSFFVA